MRVFLASICLLSSMSASAHPTSFEGAKGIMGYHSAFLTHNQLNYSWKYWLATGVHHIRRPDLKNSHASFATANFLLHRWNGEGLQANIYAVVGGGQSELSGETRASGIAQVQFDIEDRDYYFLAKHVEAFNEDFVDLKQTVVRFGVTPYVGSYDDFHTWIILEGQDAEFAGGDRITDMTPFLRFFYKNLLFEIGQSFAGVSKFNYIIHF